MNPFCDPETGICTPSTLQDLYTIGQDKLTEKTEIIYVGDPMCSWCWGISPSLIQLRDHYRTKEIGFKVMVGGLRPGGGDPWNDEMKNFLKGHWEHVHEASGQPFGYALMEREDFNYDTEPSCRAVVAARPFVETREMEFFEAIQQKFYVDSEDPTNLDFYQSICTEFEIDFHAFTNRFESEEIRYETNNEFTLNRQWGVQGYPTILLLHKDQLFLVANGYASFDQMKNQIEKTMEEVAKKQA
ncbi:MAG: DsbA family protein [Ekhidna sp.]